MIRRPMGRVFLTTFCVACCLFCVVLGNQPLQQCVIDDDTKSAGASSSKVEPIYAKFWEISYHGTYKILTNKASDLTYLLYQCSTEPPPDHLDGRHSGVIAIPIEGVAITSTPMIAYLELLGLRRTIKGYIGFPEFISSPCLLELIEVDEVLVASSGPALAAINSNLVGLVHARINVGLEHTISMEEYAERSILGSMEWIKVYGALFNQEQLANDLFDQATCRIQEIVDNVANATGDLQRKPKVLWAYYSDFCEGWDVAECPNYYCDFATLCKAEILHSSEGSAGSAACGGAPFMTTDEFVEFGKEADHWIYPSNNWDETYAANEAVLSAFRSVQSRSVFDYQGAGPSAWFEQRYAEYDVALNDFCLLAGTVVSDDANNQRFWFRNVFDEEVGMVGDCDDVDAPLISRATEWSQCAGSIAMMEETLNKTMSEESLMADSPAAEERNGSG